MLYFVYPLIIAALALCVLLYGFIAGRKGWVLFALIIPCFTGSPIITFSRGAAAAFTASDIISLGLLLCLLARLHWKWRAPKSPDWYKPARLFFLLGLIGVVCIGPFYTFNAFSQSHIISDRSLYLAGIPLPILMGCFYATKLVGLGAYAHFFCHVTVSWPELRLLVHYVILTCTILAVGIVISRLEIADLRLANPETYEYQGAKIFGVNKSPSGRMCALGAFLCIALLYRSRSVLAAGCLLVLILGLLFCGSRGGILDIVVGLCVMMIISKNRAILLFPFLIIIFVFITLITAVTMKESVLDRLTESFHESSIAEAGGRTEIWLRTIDYLAHHPNVLVSGLGPFNFYYGIPENDSIAEHAHNDYLTCVTEMGIAGLALLLIILAKIFNLLVSSNSLLGVKKSWLKSCLFAALCGLLAAGLFEPSVYWSNGSLPMYRILVAVYGGVSMLIIHKQYKRNLPQQQNRI